VIFITAYPERLLNDERLEPSLYPLAPGTPLPAPPAEPVHLPFDVDWSLALRGSFTQDEDGETYDTGGPQGHAEPPSSTV
jgi:hypothetical protein